MQIETVSGTSKILEAKDKNYAERIIKAITEAHSGYCRSLQSALAVNRMLQGTAARAMGAKHANLLRYAAPAGTVLIRWDGSHQPDIWMTSWQLPFS